MSHVKVNQQLFAEIYETHYKRVYNYISYRINNHTDTEDLVSQVFLKVVEKFDRFDPKRAALSTWIISITRNTVADYYRAGKKISSVEIDSLGDTLSSSDEPGSIIVRNEQNRVLIKALNKLTDRERNLIALKYGAELGNKEIAQIMELTESNVAIIIFRSLQKLRGYFKKEDLVCNEIMPEIGKMC